MARPRGYAIIIAQPRNVVTGKGYADGARPTAKLTQFSPKHSQTHNPRHPPEDFIGASQARAYTPASTRILERR